MADMADIIDLMLGTGARIGEVLALRWSDVDLDSRRVKISATIKTETGVGTYRKPLAEARLVELSTCGRCAPAAPVRNSSRAHRRGVHDSERNVAPGKQRRAALASDPERYRLGLGNAHAFRQNVVRDA